MKHIAFVVNELDMGGVSRALIELLKRFDYSKYRVTLWVNRGVGLLQEQVPPQVKLELWGCSDTRARLFSQIRDGDITGSLRGIFFRLLSRLTRQWDEINAICAVRSLPRASDKRFDCVICYQGISGVVISNCLYRLSAAKRAIWIHGSHNRPHRLKPFFARIYNGFDRIFCVSDALKEEVSAQYPVVQHKLQVIGNPIDSENIRRLSSLPAADLPLLPTALVTVGRLSPEKGQQMIPRTARMLLDAGYDIHWYLVGDGSLRKTIADETKKYGAADRVHLLGTRENPYPYIKHCAVYVQTSLSEGWCLTVQEARILQKPIVTTPVPAIGEQIVRGKTGLMVDDTTPEALFEGIRTLLDHPELREKFTKNLGHEICDSSAELQKLYDFIES